VIEGQSLDHQKVLIEKPIQKGRYQRTAFGERWVDFPLVAKNIPHQPGGWVCNAEEGLQWPASSKRKFQYAALANAKLATPEHTAENKKKGLFEEQGPQSVPPQTTTNGINGSSGVGRLAPTTIPKKKTETRSGHTVTGETVPQVNKMGARTTQKSPMQE